MPRRNCYLVPPWKMPYITMKSRISLMLALIYGSTAAPMFNSVEILKMCSRFELKRAAESRIPTTSYIHTVPTHPQVNKKRTNERTTKTTPTKTTRGKSYHVEIRGPIKAIVEKEAEKKTENVGLKFAEIFVLLLKIQCEKWGRKTIERRKK